MVVTSDGNEVVTVKWEWTVIVNFVVEDDKNDDELKVSVDGRPETCRGFFTRASNQPNILCNIARFAATSASEQYKLIHHEFAGLVYLEKNEGAASDYFISNQLTDYLEEVTLLKLAIKKKAVSSMINGELKNPTWEKLPFMAYESHKKNQTEASKICLLFTNKTMKAVSFTVAEVRQEELSNLFPNSFSIVRPVYGKDYGQVNMMGRILINREYYAVPDNAEYAMMDIPINVIPYMENKSILYFSSISCN